MIKNDQFKIHQKMLTIMKNINCRHYNSSESYKNINHTREYRVISRTDEA